MIEWIANEQNQTIVYQTEGIKTYAIFNLSYVKHLCLDHLFTYEGYIKAIKHQFDFKYRIPIYLDASLILIATRRIKDYENIWINYASIASITYIGNRIRLGFTSHQTIDIAMTRQAFSEQIKRILKIKFHISKHFHKVDYRK